MMVAATTRTRLSDGDNGYTSYGSNDSGENSEKSEVELHGLELRLTGCVDDMSEVLLSTSRVYVLPGPFS